MPGARESSGHIRRRMSGGRWRIYPVPLPLEGVGGKGDLTGRVMLIEPVPISCGAMALQLPKDFRHLPPVGSPSPKRSEPPGLADWNALSPQPNEHGRRA